MCGYNPEKNLFNMPPEESEVAGNLCHKTPIRMEVGEKQTEERVGRHWPHTPGKWRQRVSGVPLLPARSRAVYAADGMFLCRFFFVCILKERKKRKRE